MLRLLLLVSAFYLLAVPGESSACGSVAHSFWNMSLETDKDRLDAFLESHSCGYPAEYEPDRADPYIALVLVNAVRAGVSKNRVEKVLLRYNCASLARERSGYNEIVEYLGADRFAGACDPQVLARIYVVIANGGASLRKEPTKSASKIGAIAEGSAVRNGKPEGNWVLVETYLGVGYMHISTLKPYQGES